MIPRLTTRFVLGTVLLASTLVEIGLWEETGRISVTMPKNGSAIWASG